MVLSLEEEIVGLRDQLPPTDGRRSRPRPTRPAGRVVGCRSRPRRTACRSSATSPWPTRPAVVDYLRDLGVGAVYLSPILQSTSGRRTATTRPTSRRIDADRGGAEGWADAAGRPPGEAGLGVVIDIVPNHVGISVPAENPAWWDVLRLGPESAYAALVRHRLGPGRIVVPVLGDDADAEPCRTGSCATSSTGSRWRPGTWSEGRPADDVHARQHYELVHHSRGNAELNYRRFFAVTTLAGVRVGGPGGLRGHPRADRADWSADGVTGLRVDHPDGLVDPAGVPGTAARAGARTRGSRWRRSWSRASSCRRLAGGRHHRLRRDARGERGLRRPRRRAARSPSSTCG